ncbi:phage terminase small subunit [Blautia schinkii]|nr:phage terminase small subunit [Blautia schinkii]
MPRKADERTNQAKELYLQGKKLVEIASQLNLPEGTVRSWKNRYKWECNVAINKRNVAKRNKGGQPGNKNALGNDGGAPKQNKNAVKTGEFETLFFDTLNEDELQLIEMVQPDKERLLLQEIQLLTVRERRMLQRIDSLKNLEAVPVDESGAEEGKAIPNPVLPGMSVVKYKTGIEKGKITQLKESEGILGQIQAVEDALTRVQARRQRAIEMLHRFGYDDARLEVEIKKLEPNPQDENFVYHGIPANMVAPTFAPVVFDIAEQAHTEYVFPGGRGSTKSSFVSLQVIDLLMKHEDTHAVVMRQVADTLRGSVYQQILWAIEALGLSDEFHATVSPMEITRIRTGQKIYFRGADDPGKVKSIKVPFGYISILWLEELDQFAGPESVRKIEQSVIRGGELAYIFKSFNPPKSASNWANKYIKIPKATRLVVESTYLDVPKKWLGKPFLDEAEFLKEVNPTAYENEYLGVANGTGGNVFDNVVIREITDNEIAQFDRLYNGLDWGWYPDPFHFVRCHYDAARLRLIIFVEYRCRKQSNRQTADKLIEMGITGNDLITCDSAEEKSVSDYRSYGLLARGAEKGPGSVDYSMKWLQSLREIVIDNTRCPETATEFLEYEYERDKDGEVISGYPDKNNHAIDAVRYATNPIWKRRGQ